VLRTLIENKGDNSEYFKYSIEKLEAVPTSCYALGNIIGSYEIEAKDKKLCFICLFTAIMINTCDVLKSPNYALKQR